MPYPLFYNDMFHLYIMRKSHAKCRGIMMELELNNVCTAKSYQGELKFIKRQI